MQVLVVTYPDKKKVVGVIEFKDDTLTDIRQKVAQLAKDEYPLELEFIGYNFHDNLGYVERRITPDEKYKIVLTGSKGRLLLKAVVKEVRK